MVEVDIANVGEVQGTLEATLKVNGVDTDSRMLTLPAGAKDKASFTIIRDLPGDYDISIEEQSTILTVPEVETYTSEQYLYSIPYPNGWVLDESVPERVTMVKPGLADIGVSTLILPVGVSLDEVYAIVVDNTEKDFPDLRELSRTEVKENGAVVAYDVMFTYTDQGTQAKMRLVVSKRGRYGFARWGEAREAVYEQNKPLLDTCLESFEPPEVAVGSYTNTTHGFSITLPNGWDGIETGKSMPLLVAENSVGEPIIYFYVYMDRIYEDTAAEDHALDIAAVWSEEPGYRIESQRDVTLGEATDGYEVVFTYTENGYAIKRKVISVIRGTQAFIAIVYTAASTYDGARGTIDQLTGSFTLVERRPFGASRQNSLFLSWGEIVTLDPALFEGSPEGIVGAMFSGLVRIDKNLKVVPDIAQKWDVSNDGETYTFYLREGVKFHDGKPLTAYDFEYSWERACDPETGSEKARLFLGDVVGAEEMLTGKATELSGVRVIDDLTLEVTIDDPRPYFLGKLAYPTAYVVDRANVARGMNWIDKPNGTGPFKLKEWKKDELLILERNADYYLEPAKLEHVVLQIFAGRPMMMYEQGEIDMTDVGLFNLERVIDPTGPLNKELLTIPLINLGYLGFNVTKPPFDDPKVRRAFALALDMDKILEVSFKGNSERAGGFLPPGIPGHNDELEPLPFNPELAGQLITESKYGSIDNLPPIVFYELYSLGPIEEAMIGMWQANLGVAVEARIIEEREEWLEMSHNREFQLFSTGWQADYSDPQNFLEVLFHSQSEDNNSAYSNSEVDAALEKAAVEQNEEVRLKMYQDIEKMILGDLPVAPFYQSTKRHILVKPYVEGYYLAPMGIHIWKDISIRPH
ncbi:ABC transporter substrate-binding protein [Chloroflexota bacterium]